MIDQGASPYSPPKANLEGGGAQANDLPLASAGARLAAHLLDAFIFVPPIIVAGVISFVIQPQTVTVGHPGAGATIGGAIAILSAIAIGVYQLISLSTRGQTIGKRVMKIRIVRTDGLLPGFVVAVVLRTFVGEGLLWIIPLYAIVDCLFVFRPDRRCIHDLIAGTRVVMADAAPSAVAVPAM